MDEDKFEIFEREIRIEDGCKEAKFESIYSMEKQEKKKRFSEMGFWYEPKNLIERIITSGCERSKKLKWKFIFNKREIKESKLKSVKVSYVISIPGMFPISNGQFDISLAPTEDNVLMSSLLVKHKIKNLHYVISLEKDIKVESHPTFKVFPISADKANYKVYPSSDKSDIFYNRHCVKITNPQVGAKILTSWEVERRK